MCREIAREGGRREEKRRVMSDSLPRPQTNARMGELAEKIQDLEFIVDLMQELAVKFKPTAAAI